MARVNDRKHAQAGFSLIEVLVAALILGVGLLGVLTQQSRAVQFNQQAYFYSQANILLQDMAERMRVNHEAADEYRTNFDQAAPAGGDCYQNDATTIECTPEQLADWDLADWKGTVEKLLPDGEAQIEAIPGALNGHRVAIRFNTGTIVSDDLVTETVETVVEL